MIVSTYYLYIPGESRVYQSPTPPTDYWMSQSRHPGARLYRADVEIPDDVETTTPRTVRKALLDIPQERPTDPAPADEESLRSILDFMDE